MKKIYIQNTIEAIAEKRLFFSVEQYNEIEAKGKTLETENGIVYILIEDEDEEC